MIKNFIQKYRTILLTVLITAVTTTAIASGYFAIKNEKKKSSQQVELLQKSVEELQVKNAEYQEVSKAEKDISTTEIATQQAPVVKKSVEAAPIKAEPVEVEEKLVSCVAFDGTTLKVSEDECDEIKQKNAIVERIMDKYDDCISESKSRFQDKLDTGGYQAIWVETYNSNLAECLSVKNSQLKKLK